MNRFTRFLILSLVAVMSGCSTLEGLFGPAVRGPAEVTDEDLAALPAADAIDPHRFVIESGADSVVGEPQVVLAREENTLADVAREYGLGYDELLAANPGIDPWLPGDGTPIILPTQFVLPDTDRAGIVLNIATKRLFYFPADGIERNEETGEVERQLVLTYPIGIGRVGWETPLGSTTVVSKAKDPTWWVPASVRAEHAELGNPLPATVPPGPDNPLGTRVLKLDMPGYLIHGTNQPFGVGMRVSHGCVRLYPENIEYLYELVAVGEPVTIINEPYLLGRLDGNWYFESHAPLEDDTVEAAARLDALLAGPETAFSSPLAEHVRTLAADTSGLPVRIAEYDSAEVRMRLARVHNTIETDPDAPTLEEVREMIDEAVAEAQEEGGTPDERAPATE